MSDTDEIEMRIRTYAAHCHNCLRLANAEPPPELEDRALVMAGAIHAIPLGGSRTLCGLWSGGAKP